MNFDFTLLLTAIGALTLGTNVITESSLYFFISSFSFIIRPPDCIPYIFFLSRDFNISRVSVVLCEDIPADGTLYVQTADCTSITTCVQPASAISRKSLCSS